MTPPAMLTQPGRSTAAEDGGGEASRRHLPAAGEDIADYTGADTTAMSLATTEGRLRTFRDGAWPVSFLPAEKVAAAGFYSLRRGNDTVKCFYCDVVVNSWEPGDDPLVEHRKWSRRCPFLNSHRRGCIDAISYDSCSPFEPAPPPASWAHPPATPKATPVHATKPTWPLYRTREARMSSFKDWPPAIPVKPAALSEAGFFYTGSGDRTICYYCGRGLRDWEPGDDPWVEHELWFPGCWHVALHRGSDFVKDIAESRDALIAAKKNPRETTIAAKKNPRETATDTTVESPKLRPLDGTPDNQVGKTESSATEEKRLCKICFENEMGVVFLPCGHIVACVDCALSLSDCPVCRQPFQNTARIYLT